MAEAVDAPVWVTFFTTVAIGYVRAVPEVDSTVLVTLLPHLREGLRAQDAADFQVRAAGHWTRPYNDWDGDQARQEC